jgi:TP901 family phage tail tape measure protein
MAAINLDIGGNTRRLDRDIQKTVNRVYSINLKTRGDQPLGRITGKVNEFTKSLDASNARVIAFGASAGIIFGLQRAFSALVSSTIEVQKSLQDINVILNVSAQNLQKFGGELFNIAKNTGQSFQEVAKAATEFSRQGLGVEETLKRTNEALILSRLSGLDAAKSVEALTAAVNSYASQAVTATEVVNKFATVDAAFAVSSADLAEALARVGSSAAQSGVSLNELIAIVTSAQQTTARGGAVIGNSFKTIFTRLQRGRVVDLLGTLGISDTDSSGQLKSTIQLLQDLGKVYDTLGARQQAAVAEQVGGVFQINILKAALADLGKEYSIYNSALNVASGATDQAIRRNNELNKTYAAQLNALQENAKQLAASGGERLLGPTIDRLVGGTNTLLSGFNESDGQSVGAVLGKGILDGLGQFIAGPGLALIGGVLLKLFRDLGKFATGSVQQLLGLNTAATQQRDLQASIQQILSKNPQLLELALKGEQGLNTAANSLLASLQKQTVELQKQAQVAQQISKAFISQAGVRVAGGVPVVPTGRPGKAAGYIPNFAEELQAKELGATSNVKAVSGIGKIGGQSFEANNQELQIRNFANTGETAVIPKYGNGIQEATKMIAKGESGSILDKSDRNKAKGFIPNFAKTLDYKITDGDSTINLNDKKQGRLLSVDAIESWQKYGSQATQLAKQILPKEFPDTQSLLKSAPGKAAYNRYSFKSTSLQKKLIEQGLGVPDIRYAGQEYKFATLNALNKNIGLWSDKRKGFYVHPKAQQFIKQYNLEKKLSANPDIDKNKKNFILGSATRFGTGRFSGKLLPQTYKSGNPVNFQNLFSSGFIPNFAQKVPQNTIDVGDTTTSPLFRGKVSSLIYPQVSPDKTKAPASTQYLGKTYKGLVSVAGINKQALKGELPDLEANLDQLLVRESNQFGQAIGGTEFLQSANELPNIGAAKGAVGVAFEGGLLTLLQRDIQKSAQNARIDFTQDRMNPKFKKLFHGAPGSYEAKYNSGLTGEVLQKMLRGAGVGEVKQSRSGAGAKLSLERRSAILASIEKDVAEGKMTQPRRGNATEAEIRRRLPLMFPEAVKGAATGYIPNFAAPLVRAIDDKELRMMLSKFGKGYAFQNMSADTSAMNYGGGAGTYMWDAFARPGASPMSDRQAYKQNIRRGKNWAGVRKANWLVRFNRDKLLNSELLPDMETGGASVYSAPLSKSQIVWPIKQANGPGRIFEKDIPAFLSGQINDAIKRETEAGIPKNQIYLAQEDALKKANPSGLGVFNKRDEPNKSARRNAMRSKGFAKGYIPNFAETPESGAASVGTAATAIAAQLSTLAFTFAFSRNEVKQAMTDLTKSVKNAASVQRNQLAKEIKEKRREAQARSLGGKVLTPQEQREITKQNAKTLRQDPSLTPRREAAQNIKPGIFAKGKAFAGVNAFGLATAAPILAQTLSQAIPQDTRGGRIGATATGAVGNIGSGAATGFLVGGPVGAAIGAAASALLEIPNVVNSITTKVPELEKSFTQASTELTKFSDAGSRLLTSSSELQAAYSEASPSQEKINKLTEQFAKALGELSTEDRNRLKIAQTVGQLEEEYAKILSERTKELQGKEAALALQQSAEQKGFLGRQTVAALPGSENEKLLKTTFKNLLTGGRQDEKGLKAVQKSAQAGIPQLQNLLQRAEKDIDPFSGVFDVDFNPIRNELENVLNRVIPESSTKADQINSILSNAEKGPESLRNVIQKLIATYGEEEEAIINIIDIGDKKKASDLKEAAAKKEAVKATNEIIDSLQRNIRAAQLMADANRATALADRQFQRGTSFADQFTRPAETVNKIVGPDAPLAQTFGLREELRGISFKLVEGVETQRAGLVDQINQSIKDAFDDAVKETVGNVSTEGTSDDIKKSNKEIITPLANQQEKAFDVLQGVLNDVQFGEGFVGTEALLEKINQSLTEANINSKVIESITKSVKESADKGNLEITKLRDQSIQEFKTLAKEQSQKILIAKIGQAQTFGGGIDQFLTKQAPGASLFEKVVESTKNFDEFQYRSISQRQRGVPGVSDGRFDYKKGTNEFRYQSGAAKRARQQMAPEYGRSALELIGGLQDFTGYTPNPEGKAYQAGVSGLKEFYDKQLKELQTIAKSSSTPQLVKDEITAALGEVSKLGGTENIAKLQVAQRTGALTESAFEEITGKFQNPVLETLRQQAEAIKNPEDRARFEEEIKTLSSDLLVSSDPTVKAINITNNILKQLLQGLDIEYKPIITSPAAPKIESKAKGYIPALNKESRAISRGVGGAKAGDRPQFIPNLNGIPAFVNTGEMLVDDYGGSGQTAVLTRDMQNAMVAAKGFIPNFAELTAPKSVIDKILATGLTDNPESAKEFIRLIKSTDSKLNFNDIIEMAQKEATSQSAFKIRENPANISRLEKYQAVLDDNTKTPGEKVQARKLMQAELKKQKARAETQRLKSIWGDKLDQISVEPEPRISQKPIKPSELGGTRPKDPLRSGAKRFVDTAGLDAEARASREAVDALAVKEAERKIAEAETKVKAPQSASAAEKAASSSKAAKSTAGKAAGKATGKTVGKTVGKAVGKSVVKKIPLIGLGAGVVFGIGRALEGDFTGAGLEVASGVTGTLPGLGTAASVGIDAALIARDIQAGTATQDTIDAKSKPSGRGRKQTAEEKKVSEEKKQQSINNARYAFSTAFNKNWPLDAQAEKEFAKLWSEKPATESPNNFIKRLKESAPKQNYKTDIVKATKDDIDAFYGRGKYAPVGSKERTEYENKSKIAGLIAANQRAKFGTELENDTPLFEDPIQRNINKGLDAQQSIKPTIKPSRVGLINGRPAIEWQNDARIDAMDEAVKRGDVSQETADKVLESELSKKTIENRRKQRSQTPLRIIGGKGNQPAMQIKPDGSADYVPKAIRATPEEIEKERKQNFARGFIPNFAKDYISNLAELEAGLSGENPAMGYNKKIGPFMYNKAQSRSGNLNEIIAKDHPEGLKTAMKNSMKMQKSVGIMNKGYIPNFAVTDQSFTQLESSFNNNTSALTSLAGGIESLNSTLTNFETNFANLNNSSNPQSTNTQGQGGTQPNVTTTTNAPVNVVVNAQGGNDIASAVGEAVENAIPMIIDKVKVALGQKVPPRVGG